MERERLTRSRRTEQRGRALFSGRCIDARGTMGGESETAARSPGTTVYYQDSSRGSAQASEAAGGGDRGGRKGEDDEREVGN